MKKRKLGKSGLEIAPLALGGNVFGWTADEATSFAILDRFIDAGFNFIDTADVYSIWAPGHKGGESEAVLGKWIKARGKRAKALIATKVGMRMADDRKGLKKAHIMRSVEESLKRLNTDHIDLYQSHTDDAEAPLEETLGAYEALLKQGKVRAIGASNYTAPRLKTALDAASGGLPRYQSLQPLYNMMERAFEADLGPLCAKENIGVIPYYSLASGFLTGKYKSAADLKKSPRGGGVKKYLDARGQRVIAALEAAAKQHGATPAQVALAWLMAKPAVTAPIVSATSVAQLDEILKAASLKLEAKTMAALDKASAA